MLLVAETRNVPHYKEAFRNVTALIDELLIGSAFPDRKRIFPAGTKLISLFVLDKTITMNLSYDILKTNVKAPLSLPGILQSVVNNILYNFKGINEVVFYIEGELVDTEIKKPSGDIQKMYIHDFDESLLK